MARLVMASLLVVVFAIGWTNRAKASPSQNCPALLNHTLPRLQDDQPQNLCQHAGKVCWR